MTLIRFSALQRAENSSIEHACARTAQLRASFSALQRAENSSTRFPPSRRQAIRRFQCSSASRKFLNAGRLLRLHPVRCVSVLFSEPKIPQLSPVSRLTSSTTRFSALQRAENSSTNVKPDHLASEHIVSVLFSEPKIPQHRPSHLRPSIFPTAMITLRHS